MAENYPRERDLLRKYHDGLTNEQENRQITHAFNKFVDASKEERLETANDEIGLRIWSKLPVANLVKEKPMRHKILKFSAAAAAVMILLGFWMYHYSNSTDKLESEIEIVQDLAPGTTGATLTLANGKVVNISDTISKNAAEDAGIILTKVANGHLRYEIKPDILPIGVDFLQTGYGQQIEVILPDKSLVFLNSGSSLRYARSFLKESQRRVELSGEGYFQVKKDKSRPFVVVNKNQSVTVLGTTFNISAYEDEKIIRTTLLEGSVKINNSILRPGQIALNRDGHIAIQTANLQKETSWIDNDFYFDNERLESVMNKISRWYDVTVTYSSQDLKEIPLNAHLSRTKSLATIMKGIAATTNIGFEIKGKQLLITK